MWRIGIKFRHIVRLENRNQVSTYCPYATSTRSFTRTLSESKDDDDDEFICVDVVLFDGACDVVYCKSTTTAKELKDIIQSQLFVRNIDSYELFSDETGEMFEVPPKTMMKHLFRDDEKISPIVHLKPTSDKMLKVKISSEEDERSFEILVHAEDTIQELRRAINSSVPYVECDEPYVIEHDGKILFDENVKVGDVLSDGETIQIKIRVHVVDEKNKPSCMVLMNLANDRVSSLRDAIRSKLDKRIVISGLHLVRPDNSFDDRDLLVDVSTMLSSVRLEIDCDGEIYSYPAFFDGMKVCCVMSAGEKTSAVSSGNTSSGDSTGKGKRQFKDMRSKNRSCCGCCGGTDDTGCTVS